jgi:hypothetical protein
MSQLINNNNAVNDNAGGFIDSSATIGGCHVRGQYSMGPKPYALCNYDEGHDITALTKMQGLYRALTTLMTPLMKDSNHLEITKTD